jgi:hypothetical protein
MSEWQPIETAPKDGRSLWLAYPCCCIRVGRWDSLLDAWSDHWLYIGSSGNVGEPTHWMPLPEPPAH